MYIYTYVYIYICACIYIPIYINRYVYINIHITDALKLCRFQKVRYVCVCVLLQYLLQSCLLCSVHRETTKKHVQKREKHSLP